MSKEVGYKVMDYGRIGSGSPRKVRRTVVNGWGVSCNGRIKWERGGKRVVKEECGKEQLKLRTI